QPGDPVTFTVSVANNGPGPVDGLAVWDSLDVIFESPSHTVSVGSLTGDTLWSIPTLAAGDTATWTTTVTVSANAGGASVTNSAILRAVTQNDTTPANDTATVAVDVALSLLPTVTISQPADSSVFDPGELVTFTGSANDPEDGDVSPSIEWASSLDGILGTGRSVSTDQLSTGVHTVAATATDSDGGVGADTITVTVALYTIPATLNVPFGSTASLPISLTEQAPTGGVTLTVTSSDESVTRPQSSTVFIPEGAQSANATLEGIAPGTADVSVSSAQFGVVTSLVSVTAQLNILSNTVRFPSTFTDDITIRLESQGNPLAAPSGGLDVSFVTRDPACVQA
ncbi:MAG: hypothetical protein R3246_17445, partial [Acidimicrobiia bacterium]|nr:hypothetical protein [Acidimicrobiia bacterium]